MTVGIQFDGGAIQGGGLKFVGEGFDHRSDLGLGDFHVEQQAVSVVAVAEGLVGGERGGCQQGGATRKIEDVTVPVEAGEVIWGAANNESEAAKSVRVTRFHPISFCLPGQTFAPSVAARSWLPRQTPRTGFAHFNASSIRRISRRK